MSGLGRAVDWIEAHWARFAVDPRGEHTSASVKTLAEIGHLAGVLSRRADALQETGRRWLEQAWQRIEESGRLPELLARTPVAAALLVPFAARVPAAWTGAIRTPASPASVDDRTLVYLVAALRALGVPASERLVAEAERKAVLARRPPPWSMRLDDMYLLTHEVFYATAWGERGAELPAPAARYLTRWLPLFVHLSARRADWDLLAELLAAGAGAGIGLPAAAWAALAGAQGADGSVITVHRPTDVSATLAPRDDFLARRHTTIVSAIAWALGEQTGALPAIPSSG